MKRPTGVKTHRSHVKHREIVARGWTKPLKLPKDLARKVAVNPIIIQVTDRMLDALHPELLGRVMYSWMNNKSVRTTSDLGPGATKRTRLHIYTTKEGVEVSIPKSKIIPEQTILKFPAWLIEQMFG